MHSHVCVCQKPNKKASHIGSQKSMMQVAKSNRNLLMNVRGRSYQVHVVSDFSLLLVFNFIIEFH